MVKRVVITKARRHKGAFIVPLCLCVFVVISAFGIEKEPLQEYHARRERLAQRIKGNVLVLRSAPDQELVKYQQDPNFYYLTGHNEEEAGLIILPATKPGEAQSAWDGPREIRKETVETSAPRDRERLHPHAARLLPAAT